jgi:hypothetical protein
MATQFASGRHSIAECDVCGFRFKLSELKKVVIKAKVTGIKACPTCWDKDHPQLMLGVYPINDPQAVREPRPDNSYGSSRNTQWGWAPVGGGDGMYVENDLVATASVGTVVVVT